ncbi:aryl-alcohol dehydrogenase [Bombardia bombarda]|uniref:Aryl-alcohol dehydrogenase n=1 Tax=Bombardia bombarda TaxID=252184 RepID=A0AA39XIN0_9PEZI|nr:aryl-alcohol dehydrogenase [Bombardia bombarda]
MADTSSTYDFIIVGGGTAGLVVAARLSEDPAQKVLVLEAGADHSLDPRVITPLLFATLQEGASEATWNYHTTPQANLKERTVQVNQGRALGGSSAVNAFVFVPPSKGLIDAWGSLGNEGWSWDVFRKYLAKVYTPPVVSDTSDQKRFGIDGYPVVDDASGPLRLDYSGDWSHPIREAWTETFKAKNQLVAEDPYINPTVGAFSHLSSTDPVTKQRNSSVSAYYNGSKDRENLTVVTNALVDKIVFEQDSGPLKAIGVQYQVNGSTLTATAAKEVVLSAGAIQSPKVLELSGIGNAKLLAKHNIPTLIDLPSVGTNLQDHIFCSINYEANDDVPTHDALRRQEPEAIQQAMTEYMTHQRGLMTTIGINTSAYLPVPDAAASKDTLASLLQQSRELASATSPAAGLLHDAAENTLLSGTEPSGSYFSVIGQHILPVDPASDSPAGPVPGKFVALSAMLSQPVSRGSVHISSADPSALPTIDPAYFSSPVDLEVLARHILHLQKLAAAPQMGRVLKQELRLRDPASDVKDLEQAKRYLQTSAVSMWHLAGSCPMLPRDKGGVVDSKLKVYGVGNLRVVDASIMPIISTANTQLTVYAIAERAAALVKEEWGLK